MFFKNILKNVYEYITTIHRDNIRYTKTNLIYSVCFVST